MKQHCEDVEFYFMEKLEELGIRRRKGGWKNIMKREEEDDLSRDWINIMEIGEILHIATMEEYYT